mmetsp:Transcript_28152/g.66111  ORF Transcript_28152/g.66111 Transcript_28152/m.66111 type:complete len:100 (-) Transcript_28152:102-401(-)
MSVCVSACVSACVCVCLYVRVVGVRVMAMIVRASFVAIVALIEIALFAILLAASRHLVDGTVFLGSNFKMTPSRSGFQSTIQYSKALFGPVLVLTETNG